jgi:hypothetical protein
MSGKDSLHRLIIEAFGPYGGPASRRVMETYGVMVNERTAQEIEAEERDDS